MANPARATTTDFANLAPAQSRLAALPSPQKQAALNSASDYLDGKITDQVQLPLLPPYPQDVIEFECVYAAYRLLLAVGFSPQSPIDQALKADYQEKLVWADRVAKGEITPNWTGSGNVISPGAGDVFTSSMRGWSDRGNSLPMSTPPWSVDGFVGD